MNEQTILDVDCFPIVGWAGPSGDMLRADVMSGMAEAGFTVSHSGVQGSASEVIKALDIAAESKIKLLLVHPAWHVGDEYRLDDARKAEVRELVAAVRDHPGLYGYHLRDEPRFGLLPLLAEMYAFMREMDDYHAIYINHFPPIEGWGAPTAEGFWRRYIDITRPQFLSYDHYALTVATSAEIEAHVGEPNVFPSEKLIVKPDYFDCLELVRNLSLAYSLPFWAFTCSVRHGPYPTPTEGHIRFQLMNNLAYGALGLQYFTYAHDGAMVRRDGSTTPTWEIARRVNRDVHVLAPVMRKLRNVGVFRTGSLWSGTRSLHRSHLQPLVACEGDPVTIGFFMDNDNLLYLMVVNGNPCEWSSITLKVNVSKEKLYVFDCSDGLFRELWPPDPHNQMVSLAPGEGRLFRVGGEGLGQNF
ncbi:MAG: hypothetical protein M1434_11925 [Chloroflexi bacterium]|nr:hypothetical protein [Chloroflexota bacterium]MCL5275431.1 hypothetical protein [Chloroflexota bacterium]